MPTINKSDYEEYKRLKRLSESGLLLSPEGIRFICNANNNKPAKIGRYLLELLPRIEQHEQEALKH